MPVPVAQGASAPSALKSKEIDNIMEHLVENPTAFVVPTERLAQQMLAVTKQLYDLALAYTPRDAPLDIMGPLSELVVDGFDEDQVWAELELRNGPLGEWLSGGVESLAQANKRSGGGVRVLSKDGPRRTQHEEEESEEEDMMDEDDGDGSMGEEEDEEEDEQEEDEEEQEEEKAKEGRGESRAQDASGRSAPKKKAGLRAQVEDQFFKLSEMAQFLDKMDQMEMRRRGSDDEDEDDEGGVDLFNDPDEVSEYEDEIGSGSEDEDEDEARTAHKHGDEIRYEDFYGNQSGVDNDEMDDQSDEEEEEDESDASEGQHDLFEEDSEGEGEGTMSTFAKQQARLKRTIDEMEEANIQPKPWQLSGEASARKREANSLLEEEVEFETTMKPAPEITVEATKTLEDLIRQRVRDDVFDDVERKQALPTHTTSRQRVELDHEKSKKSLAEVYEHEYLRQVQGVGPAPDEETNKKHAEITELFKQLCAKLDALSNFHYTPARAKEELEVTVNVPAIAMEEVLPIAVSTHTQLAPEEVLAKQRREQKGDGEKTDADRNYARKAKKSQKRQRQKEREKAVKAVNKAKPGLGNKHSKKAALKSIERGEVKGASVVKQSADTSHLKSSTAFFAKLQDDVRSEIKGSKAPGKDDERKRSASAALKL